MYQDLLYQKYPLYPDFARFVKEQKDTLSEKVTIQVLWGDVEKADTWENIKKETYSLIIAHYLNGFLDDREKLLVFLILK